MSVTIETVNFRRFCGAIATARLGNSKVAAATSGPRELWGIRNATSWYLTPEGNAGFGIYSHKPYGRTLVALFNNSTTRGLGRELVKAAIGSGAIHLDCFDGFLVGYYQSLGFVETHREPNWTPGGPDVVYMSRPSSTG